MSYSDFKEYAKEGILKFLPEDYADAKVEIHEVNKINGVNYDCITVVKKAKAKRKREEK